MTTQPEQPTQPTPEEPAPTPEPAEPSASAPAPFTSGSAYHAWLDAGSPTGKEAEFE